VAFLPEKSRLADTPKWREDAASAVALVSFLSGFKQYFAVGRYCES
jgi:hypothetical protein